VLFKNLTLIISKKIFNRLRILYTQ